MKIAVIVDHKDKATDRAEIEGSYAWQLQKWLKNAGISTARVLRLGDKLFDEQIFNSKIDDQLKEYNPDFIIGLGKMSLIYLRGREVLEFDKNGNAKVSLDDERGMPFINCKTGCPALCTYTPRYIFAQYALNIIVEQDFLKAARLAKTGWKPPVYNINYIPTFEEARTELLRMYERKLEVACDIETCGKGMVTCIGFAWSEADAMTIPFVPYNYNGTYRRYSEIETYQLWSLIKKVLEENRIIGQNFCHFDHNILFTRYGIKSNLVEDTMLGFWELHPSFDKNLGFLSSLLTDNEYWKGMLKESRSGKVPRWYEFKYNCLDCLVDYQVYKRIQEELAGKPTLDNHYRFNLRVSRAYQYMSIQGVRIDKDKHNKMLKEYRKKVSETQELLNELAGKEINVRSSKQMKEWLYGELKLPVQTKAVKDKFNQRESRETADALSVYKLAGQYPEYPALTVASSLRKHLKKLSDLEALEYDDKGICRFNFNVVGTKVGRSSGSKPLYDKGVQPQNVDKAFRTLFLPPEGMLWFKADLEGADSVTMGACMQALGDSRLMDDIRHGIKPAQTVALELLTGKPYTSFSQEQILKDKHLLKTPEGKKEYKVAKAVNHGSAYKLGFAGMSDNMLRLSEGELYVSPEDCKRVQQKLFSRYNYPIYHVAMERKMRSDPFLVAANGQERRFYGRQDNTMLREMCSYLPQVHTAYVTNKNIERYYYDKEARRDGHLILKLCNQVHDELCGFVYEDDADKLAELYKKFWAVPLTIWGVTFTIEFEGQLGPSWGEQTITLDLY